MDLNTLLLLMIGLICYLVYRINYLNDKMAKHKSKVRTQMRAIASRVEASNTRAIQNNESSDSKSDSDDADIYNRLLQITNSSETTQTGNRRSRTRRRPIIINHTVGPQNNDNINLGFRLNVAPLIPGLGGFGGMTGGEGFRGVSGVAAGAIANHLTSGISNFLNGPRRLLELPQ